MAGTSYTRQSTLTDGDTITAALFNAEYNQVVTAFSYASTGTTGHQHDGGAGEGGNIEIIGDQDFLNKLVVDTSNNRWGFFVEVSSAAVEQIRIQDGAIVPVTDNDIDLGTSSLEFKDAFFDGTVTSDAFAGPLTGNVTGNVSGTAATVTTAAQSNITSLGTLTTLTVDNVIINGTTIGHTSDTDLLTLTSGVLTVAGEVDATSLDISGDIDVDGTTNLDVVDIDGAVNMATTALVTGVLTTTATQVATGGITSGSNILSDTDSTDSLGSTAVRWLKGWFDTLTAGTLTIGSGSITDSSGAISFGNENLTTTGTTTAASLALATGATVTGVDNGTLGTSATLLATQGAIKTYVDAQVDTVDTLAEVLAIGNTSSGTNVELSTTDKVQFRDSAIYINSSVDGQLDIVADTEIQIAATTIDINGAINASGEIIAASLDISGNIDVDGISNLDIVDIDGAVDMASTLQVDGAATFTTKITANGGVALGDSDQATFGTGDDLKIYHTGSHSYIDESGTGNLYIGSNNGAGVYIQGSGETLISALDDGAVTLYHDNAAKLATASGGVTITGELAATSLDISGNIDVDGTSNLDIVDIDGAVDMASTLAVGGAITIPATSYFIGSAAQGFRFNNAADTANNMVISDAGLVTVRNGITIVTGVLTANGGVVINESGIDADFRVESDGNANMLFVDGGANTVSIGTGSSFGKLRVEDTGWSLGSPYGTVAYILGGNVTDANWGHLLISQSGNTTDEGGRLAFGCNGANPIAGIRAKYKGDTYGDLAFSTRPSGGINTERLLIDSSGNLLVGKSALAIGTVGTEVRANGQVLVTATSDNPLDLNRLSTDGVIANFRKDGTTVGSIGTIASDLYIAESTSGLRFDGENNQILPSSTTASTDGTCNLGAASARFKDLYLSGGAYLGGTAAANKLDDYEEGTWTPTIVSGYASIGTVSATYTKVGDKVTVWAYINSLVTPNSSAVSIGGLPFTSKTNQWAVGELEMSGGGTGVMRIISASTQMVAYRSGQSLDGLIGTDGASHLMITITYSV